MSNTKHGLHKSPIYGVWRFMIERCEYRWSKSYKNYGGRGIKVCERWKSFQNFFDDMGHAPNGMSIERIDNDGPYSPENCRWATKKEQANNTRRNRKVSFCGELITVAEVARRTGFSYPTAYRKFVWGKNTARKSTELES